MNKNINVIEPGHTYEVGCMDNPEKKQTIQFIHKKKNEASGELELVTDGITNEDLIDVLIDRIKTLNSKVPCRENSLAITKLEEAKMWLENRTTSRELRGVEGTSEK